MEHDEQNQSLTLQQKKADQRITYHPTNDSTIIIPPDVTKVFIRLENKVDDVANITLFSTHPIDLTLMSCETLGFTAMSIGNKGTIQTTIGNKGPDAIIEYAVPEFNLLKNLHLKRNNCELIG